MHWVLANRWRGLTLLLENMIRFTEGNFHCLWCLVTIKQEANKQMYWFMSFSEQTTHISTLSILRTITNYLCFYLWTEFSALKEGVCFNFFDMWHKWFLLKEGVYFNCFVREYLSVVYTNETSVIMIYSICGSSTTNLLFFQHVIFHECSEFLG